MRVLYTKEFIDQYLIVSELAFNGNADFVSLLDKLDLCINIMHKAETDEDLPIRWHEGAKKKGYLRFPNDNCISIDIDSEHRLDAVRLDDKAIIISSIGHHKLSDEFNLFEDLDSAIKNIIDEAKKDSSLEQLCSDSYKFEQLLLSSSAIIKKEFDINSCKAIFKNDFYTNLCPLSPNVYIHNLKKCIKTLVEGNSYYGQETKIKDKSYVMQSFIDENHNFLERTVVNANMQKNKAFD